MDTDRPHPHRTPSTSTTNSELFICFTSRHASSSSMKISKSILSPGRARHHDPPVSLSTSLSRRLRTNGSLKGGQSPMFPTGAKKRGCAFENPEPSSPKVTCIGQVRVKTKKKVKQTQSLSHRIRCGGELSFRRAERQPREAITQNQNLIQNQTQASNGGGVQYQQQHLPEDECLPRRNQRWVHLPLTICEALRAFGAEFSCLFPCRSSCFSTGGSSSSEREKDAEKTAVGQSGQRNANAQSGSCGAVFARWLVALHDGEGGKPREIELVVGGGDEERTEAMERSIRNSRRHVLEDIEFKGIEKCEVKGEEEEAARVSICIPPKNALLLMRCRSDPMKMASLTNRFWESPARSKVVEKEADEEEDKEDDAKKENVAVEEESKVQDNAELQQQKENEAAEELVPGEVDQEELNQEKDANLEMLEAQEWEEKQEEKSQLEDEQQIVTGEENLELRAEKQQENQEETQATVVEAEVELSSASSQQANLEEEVQNEVLVTIHQGKAGESTTISPSELDPFDEEDGKVEAEKATLEEEQDRERTQESLTEEKESQDGYLENETVTQEKDSFESEEEIGEFLEQEKCTDDPAEFDKKSEEMIEEENEEGVSSKGLPDCLLLMMCEPKLSMEVSKEAWVCTTDFIRSLPRDRRKVNPTDGPDESKEKEKVKEKESSSVYADPALCLLQDKDRPLEPLQQPPRSSCSLPVTTAAAAASMATMIEQKLVNAVAYEPFVLTRCNSEPMRAAAKFVPEGCFWKNRKLEPPRRATLGFGAAGVGF